MQGNSRSGQVVKKIKILYLKWQLKKAYLTYHALIDRFGCRTFLAQQISVEVSRAWANVDNLWEELKQLDPKLKSIESAA